MVRKSDIITFYYFYDQENTDNVKRKNRNRNSFTDAIYLWCTRDVIQMTNTKGIAVDGKLTHKLRIIDIFCLLDIDT